MIMTRDMEILMHRYLRVVGDWDMRGTMERGDEGGWRLGYERDQGERG